MKHLDMCSIEHYCFVGVSWFGHIVDYEYIFYWYLLSIYYVLGILSPWHGLNYLIFTTVLWDIIMFIFIEEESDVQT